MSNESEYEQLQTVIRACIIFKEAEKTCTHTKRGAKIIISKKKLKTCI